MGSLGGCEQTNIFSKQLNLPSSDIKLNLATLLKVCLWVIQTGCAVAHSQSLLRKYSHGKPWVTLMFLQCLRHLSCSGQPSPVVSEGRYGVRYHKHEFKICVPAISGALVPFSQVVP